MNLFVGVVDDGEVNALVAERVWKEFEKAMSEIAPWRFIEILDGYLQINRSRVAKQAHIARSTVQQALSKNGNPTLKTIAKIVHESFI